MVSIIDKQLGIRKTFEDRVEAGYFLIGLSLGHTSGQVVIKKQPRLKYAEELHQQALYELKHGKSYATVEEMMKDLLADDE